MAGAGLISAPDAAHNGRRWGVVILALLLATSAFAQTLYKYRGSNGEWIYTDVPPDSDQKAEVRELERRENNAKFTLSSELKDDVIEMRASNPFYIPVEVRVVFSKFEGIELPAADEDFHWVVDARSESLLLSMNILQGAEDHALKYEYHYLPGDTAATHSPEGPYRVPYAIGVDHQVTQAYPSTLTHNSPDSFHAVDIAMPIGTDIFAARGGVVFDVASNNFQGGTDPAVHGRKANVVRILHSDGTYATYAHLNWHSIRVRPGDEVERGEYIAESGNTGFSSGPHLHFSVVRNDGMKIVSVPVQFTGSRFNPVEPRTGMTLTAY